MQVTPAQCEDLLAGELEPDEEVRWVARPDAVRLGIMALPVGLIGAMLLVLWALIRRDITGIEGPAETLQSHIMTGGLVLAGIVLVICPAWATRKGLRTAYVITDRRALVVRQGRHLQVQSFAVPALRRRLLVHKGNGSGDIVLHGGPYQLPLLLPIGLIALRQVDAAEALLQEIVLRRSMGHFEAEEGGQWRQIALSIGCIAMLGLGFMCLVCGSGRTATVVLTRPGPQQVDAAILYSWLNVVPLGQEQIPNVQAAEVIAIENDDGNWYYVGLRTAGDPIRVGQSQEEDRAGRIVRQVNDFIQARTPGPMTLRVPGSGEGAAFAGLCLAGLLLTGLMAYRDLRAWYGR